MQWWLLALALIITPTLSINSTSSSGQESQYSPTTESDEGQTDSTREEEERKTQLNEVLLMSLQVQEQLSLVLDQLNHLQQVQMEGYTKLCQRQSPLEQRQCIQAQMASAQVREAQLNHKRQALEGRRQQLDQIITALQTPSQKKHLTRQPVKKKKYSKKRTKTSSKELGKLTEQQVRQILSSTKIKQQQPSTSKVTPQLLPPLQMIKQKIRDQRPVFPSVSRITAPLTPTSSLSSVSETQEEEQYGQQQPHGSVPSSPTPLQDEVFHPQSQMLPTHHIYARDSDGEEQQLPAPHRIDYHS